MRYLINLTYDGSKFYGYQIQNNKYTVEGEIERVLSKILNTKINTTGSSRTDKGVHANSQYCHFDTDKKINLNKLTHAMNGLIDKSIYIKKITQVDNNFHARYSVYKKEYIYKINIGEYNPIEKDYVFQYNKKINKELLDKFCDIMSGKHNFRSFTSDKEKDSYERDVQITYKINKNILYLKFESSGFLRYMIRNIVGLLIDINDNKKKLEDIPKIFKSCDRCSCGKKGNPEGLYLNKIEFM